MKANIHACNKRMQLCLQKAKELQNLLNLNLYSCGTSSV